MFEWDAAKANKNFMSHGVLFTDASTAFFDEDAIISARAASPRERSVYEAELGR